MKDDIILELGENFREEDNLLLFNIIERVTTVAQSISNNNSEELNPYISECVKAIYLNRGSEGLNSINESGKSLSFNDNLDIMKKNIINAGLRRCF